MRLKMKKTITEETSLPLSINLNKLEVGNDIIDTLYVPEPLLCDGIKLIDGVYDVASQEDVTITAENAPAEFEVSILGYGG